MVVKRNLNTEKKVSKRQSRKVPFVLSTSMLAATFLAAGATVSADEHNGQDVNHGEIVSDVAQALPGSPEKGQIISSINQGDYELAKEILSDLIDDSEDLEEEDFEDLIPEDAVEEDATEDEGTEEDAVEEDATEEDAVEEDATEEEVAETEKQLDAQYDEIVEEITERYQSIFDRNETLLDYQDLYIEDQLVAMGVIDEKEDAEAIEEETAQIAEDVEENLEEDADGNSQDIQADGNAEVQADEEAEVETNENDAVESDETTDENASVAVIDEDADADADTDADTDADAEIQADEEAESDQQNRSTFGAYQQLTNAYEKVKNSYANFISSLK